MKRTVAALAALACLPVLASAQQQAPPDPPAAPAAAASPPTAPSLRAAWREPFDSAVLRIAVADTRGDGQDRVIALEALDESHSSLTVFRWDGTRFVAEWRTEIEDTQRLVVAGRFVPGAKDAQIVTASGWYRWDGKDYAYHAFRGEHPPVGLLQRADGSAVLLTWEAEGIVFGSLIVDEAGPALVAEPEDPAAIWAKGLLRTRREALERLAPAQYAARGLLAFWTDTAGGRRITALPLAGDQGAEPLLVFADRVAPDAVAEAFRSQPLPGAVMDLAFGDPKGLRTPSLVALTASGSNGAARMLVAFTLSDACPARARPPARQTRVGAAKKPARPPAH